MIERVFGAHTNFFFWGGTRASRLRMTTHHLVQAPPWKWDMSSTYIDSVASVFFRFVPFPITS